jgi:hypothetical protein
MHQLNKDLMESYEDILLKALPFFIYAPAEQREEIGEYCASIESCVLKGDGREFDKLTIGLTSLLDASMYDDITQRKIYNSVSNCIRSVPEQMIDLKEQVLKLTERIVLIEGSMGQSKAPASTEESNHTIKTYSPRSLIERCLENSDIPLTEYDIRKLTTLDQKQVNNAIGQWWRKQDGRLKRDSVNGVYAYSLI